MYYYYSVLHLSQCRRYQVQYRQFSVISQNLWHFSLLLTSTSSVTLLNSFTFAEKETFIDVINIVDKNYFTKQSSVAPVFSFFIDIPKCSLTWIRTKKIMYRHVIAKSIHSPSIVYLCFATALLTIYLSIDQSAKDTTLVMNSLWTLLSFTFGWVKSWPFALYEMSY